jgi:hypothetical protein
VVGEARFAAGLDAIERWHAGAGRPALLVTDDASLLDAVSPPVEADVRVDDDAQPFHFGQRLGGVIQRHGLESVLCLGAGGVPLLSAEDLAGIALRLQGGGAVTNNPYSADLTGFPVTPQAVAAAALAGRDNALPRVLESRTDVLVESLARTVATQFDIDTPADLAALAVAVGSSLPGPGPRLAACLDRLAPETGRYRAIASMLTDRTKQVLVAGRVGSHAWSYLESETACRVRLVAEERGMEAEGRAARGEARSLVGLYLDAVGTGRFFSRLPELCDGAIIDTRVILAHEALDVSREDRFLSDMGVPEDIRNPFLRDFTAAALSAPVPVLLGGHSLVSGGLMLLNELAWSRQDPA